MASIRGFGRVWPGAALIALALASAGAAGLAPWSWGESRLHVVVSDESPSCRPWSGEALIRFTEEDPAAALARAAAVAGASRVLLFTDAVFGAAPVVGKPVDVVLMPRRDRVQLLDLRVPERVPPGVGFAVEVVVGRTAGGPETPRNAILRLFRDGRRVGAQGYSARLGPGRTRTLSIRDKVVSAGLVRYRAELDEGGAREAVSKIGDLPSVLAIGASAQLEGFDWAARRPEEVAGFLEQPGVAERLDAILLVGELPSSRAQDLLADAVRGGAGLVVFGGEGFSGRPLEKILPLTDRPPGGRAVVLMLDYSGSMERRQPELRGAVAHLRAALAPTDRIALLAFQGSVVKESGWTSVSGARFDFPIRATGNTNLAPALRRAAQLFGDAPSAQKRLFVVSDGQWPDATAAAAELPALAGIYRAALFVEDAARDRHAALFPVAFVAGDDLAGALRELEAQAPDRRVEGPIRAERGDVARWIEEALPGTGPYARVPRLYARGVGERVALHAGEVPMVATLTPGGRVVVTAVPTALAALLRASARQGVDAGLVARRRDGGLALDARGTIGHAFLVEGRRVDARVAGRGRWHAFVPRVPASSFLVRFGGALRIVPAREQDELGGLTHRPDIAADIARLSGGRLYLEGLPPRGGRDAVAVTLLAAVACVIWSAMRRGVSS